MNIIKNKEGRKLVINVEGRLDTTTAPTLDNEIHTSIEGINESIREVFDITGFSELLTIK